MRIKPTFKLFPNFGEIKITGKSVAPILLSLLLGINISYDLAGQIWHFWLQPPLLLSVTFGGLTAVFGFAFYYLYLRFHWLLIKFSKRINLLWFAFALFLAFLAIEFIPVYPLLPASQQQQHLLSVETMPVASSGRIKVQLKEIKNNGQKISLNKPDVQIGKWEFINEALVTDKSGSVQYQINSYPSSNIKIIFLSELDPVRVKVKIDDTQYQEYDLGSSDVTEINLTIPQKPFWNIFSKISYAISFAIILFFIGLILFPERLKNKVIPILGRYPFLLEILPASIFMGFTLGCGFAVQQDYFQGRSYPVQAVSLIAISLFLSLIILLLTQYTITRYGRRIYTTLLATSLIFGYLTFHSLSIFPSVPANLLTAFNKSHTLLIRNSDRIQSIPTGKESCITEIKVNNTAVLPGTMTVSKNWQLIDGTQTVCAKETAYLQYNFIGTHPLQVTMKSGPQYANAEIWLDGEIVGIDQYQPTSGETSVVNFYSYVNRLPQYLERLLITAINILLLSLLFLVPLILSLPLLLFLFGKLKRITQSSYFYYFGTPLILGIFLILPVFLTNNCYSYEYNDEAAHTFVEINLAWKMLLGGQLPFINLFNNFGNPILGEPVINPFALHALTYLIFPGPLAATINRFLIITLSTGFLTFLLHQKYNFSLKIASLTSVLVVILPNNLWFSYHHPHQAVLLYFTLVLIAQHRFNQAQNILNTILLYLSFSIFVLGVGINPFLLSIPFIFISQFFESGLKINRVFIQYSLVFLAAFMLIAPSLLYFFYITPLTARSGFDYAAVSFLTPLSLLTDLVIFGLPPWVLHITASIFYSIPVLVLIFIGAFKIQGRNKALAFFILGLIPLVGVLFLLLFPTIRAVIPFVRSMDILRFLWFANLFLAIGIGTGMEKFARSKSLILKLFLIILGVISFLPVFDYFANFSNIFIFTRDSTKHICDTRFYPAEMAEFGPRSFLNKMEPYTRMATQYNPVPRGYIQSAAKSNIFGSDGRSIILNGKFKDYLQKNELITNGWADLAYYFTSTDVQALSHLGIRYIMTASPKGFSDTDWIFLAKGVDPFGEMSYLFQNPQPVTPSYLIENEKIKYLNDTVYDGNRITVNIKDGDVTEGVDLVVAFIDWPGWHASIDGRPVQIMNSEDYLLRVRVKPGDRSVLFVFEPFTYWQIALFLIASILIVTTILLWVKNSTKRYDNLDANFVK